MIKSVRRAVAAILLAGVCSAHAGIILQDTSNGSIQVDFFEPVAQSFTAEDSAIRFAFYYEIFNPGFPNDPLQLRLLSGDGLGGAELASVTFGIASDFTGFFDVDLSSVSLAVGQLYTAVLSQPGDSPYWGVSLNFGGNPYAGGRGYFTGSDSFVNSADDDFRFRVTPTGGGTVPEPGLLPLLCIGFAGLALARRRHP